MEYTLLGVKYIRTEKNPSKHVKEKNDIRFFHTCTRGDRVCHDVRLYRDVCLRAFPLCIY